MVQRDFQPRSVCNRFAPRGSQVASPAENSPSLPLFLSASWIPIHPKVLSSKLTLAQKPTWSHHFSEPSINLSCTHAHDSLISSLNKYVLIIGYVPALLEALGTPWRTWLRPHRTRGQALTVPGHVSSTCCALSWAAVSSVHIHSLYPCLPAQILNSI